MTHLKLAHDPDLLMDTDLKATVKNIKFPLYSHWIPFPFKFYAVFFSKIFLFVYCCTVNSPLQCSCNFISWEIQECFSPLFLVENSLLSIKNTFSLISHKAKSSAFLNPLGDPSLSYFISPGQLNLQKYL